MKKLLVAAIGAATAFGAFAEYTNAQRFEGMELGETSVSALGSNWSEKPNSTNTYTIVEMETVGETFNHPDAFKNATDPDNALSVKTTFGKPLSFNVVSGGTATNLESNLYFDSLVKFTVCDSTPDQTYDGAKIIMWLQENEAQTATNLYVRAGYLGDGIVTTNDYICGNTIGGDFADKWHRVTIKAMPTISTDASIPGFAIFIDGGNNTMEVSSDDPKWAVAPALTEAAAHYGQTKIFPSIIQDSTNPAKLKLTCASFDGTGTLNDMVFTSKTPTFTEAEDYVAPRATIVDNEDKPISGSPFKSLAAAVEAVNGLNSGTYTFTLTKGEVLDGTLAFNSSANIILDFAGCVLTNMSDSAAAISNAGTLTLTNSTVNVGGIYCADTGAAVYQGGDGALVIGGGMFNGDVNFDDALEVTVVGGSFKNDETYFETEERSSGTWIADGMKLKLNQTTGFYDVVPFVPVAQIEGGDQYETLAEAVEAATAGDTIVVLANCAVDAPVSFTKNITVSNDYTIAANVNYALCIGATVTFEGSGTIERAVGITGSPLCVGANETTRGAITVGTAGTLIFNGGTVSGGSGGNLIKLENGTVTMNGGLLTGGQRGIKADADKGSYTSAIIINGGTITNNSECAVNASAESASGTATITINGGVIAGAITYGKTTGTHSITIPGSSTAKFDRDQTTYCATDYKTVLSDGWYVVTAKEYYTAVSLNKATTSIETNLTETLTATFTPASAADDTYTWASSAPAIATVDQNGVVTAVAAGEATITVTATHDSSVTASCTVTVTATSPTPTPAPIVPGGQSSETYPTQKDAEDAAKDVEIAVPTAVAEELTTPEAQAAYKQLFEAKVVEDGKGGYKVEVAMTAKAAEDTQAQANADVAEVVEDLTEANVTLTTTPGLYYSFEYGTSLENMTEGARTLATGETLQLERPTTENATSGFYKVLINVSDK